jgi:hypothetical protein
METFEFEDVINKLKSTPIEYQVEWLKQLDIVTLIIVYNIDRYFRNMLNHPHNRKILAEYYNVDTYLPYIKNFLDLIVYILMTTYSSNDDDREILENPDNLAILSNQLGLNHTAKKFYDLMVHILNMYTPTEIYNLYLVYPEVEPYLNNLTIMSKYFLLISVDAILMRSWNDIVLYLRKFMNPPFRKRIEEILAWVEEEYNSLFQFKIDGGLQIRYKNRNWATCRDTHRSVVFNIAGRLSVFTLDENLDEYYSIIPLSKINTYTYYDIICDGIKKELERLNGEPLIPGKVYQFNI